MTPKHDVFSQEAKAFKDKVIHLFNSTLAELPAHLGLVPDGEFVRFNEEVIVVHLQKRAGLHVIGVKWDIDTNTWNPLELDEFGNPATEGDFRNYAVEHVINCLYMVETYGFEIAELSELYEPAETVVIKKEVSE